MRGRARWDKTAHVLENVALASSRIRYLRGWY
jgi:hypothetical protein